MVEDQENLSTLSKTTWNQKNYRLFETNTNQCKMVLQTDHLSETIQCGECLSKMRSQTAGDTVLELHVDLGNSVALKGRSIAHVTLAASIDDVPDLKSLDCLVLWHRAGTVVASNGRGVATALLTASIVASLLGHSAENSRECVKIVMQIPFMSHQLKSLSTTTISFFELL